MMKQLCAKIKQNQAVVDKWFDEESKGIDLPFYSSFDIRNAGYKAVVIDSNAFPAGFNNVCDGSYPRAIEASKSFISSRFPGTKNVLLLSELTKNPYYYDNIISIKDILQRSGYEVKVGAIEMPEKTEMESFSKGAVKIGQIRKKENRIELEGFIPDLIVPNNDFSSSDASILKSSMQPISPDINLGWYKRKKHHHFKVKNNMLRQVAELLDIDRWLIGAYYEFAEEVNFRDKKNFSMIAEKIDKCISQIKEKYSEYNIKDTPYVFVKGSASTYGMNAIPFYSGEEFLKINSRQRAKMNKSKGGKDVSEVLIQEGVATKDVVENKVAESVVYCIGNEPIGGFFRSHQEKNERENLNAVGMTFASSLFCPSALEKEKIFEDSNITQDKIRLYFFLAKLGTLAIAKELEELR